MISRPRLLEDAHRHLDQIHTDRQTALNDPGSLGSHENSLIIMMHPGIRSEDDQRREDLHLRLSEDVARLRDPVPQRNVWLLLLNRQRMMCGVMCARGLRGISVRSLRVLLGLWLMKLLRQGNRKFRRLLDADGVGLILRGDGGVGGGEVRWIILAITCKLRYGKRRGYCGCWLMVIVQLRDVVVLEDGVIRLLLRDLWKARVMDLPRGLRLPKVILRTAVEWSSLVVPGVITEGEAFFEAEVAEGG